MKKLWGGRFESGTHHDVETFSTSLNIDERLCDADLRGSLAHAKMLTSVGVLNPDEGKSIAQGLNTLREKLKKGELVPNPTAEDIHSEIERWLYEQVGDVAGKLHTARSRNDQVATATRVYLKEESDALVQEIKDLQTTLVGIAEKNIETILPGTTHLQPAQPVSLAHHLLAYFWMLQRDKERLIDGKKRIDALPLGSGALAGTSFPIDRVMVAKELGFAAVCENSLDAVSDRDFAYEFLSAGTLVMLHLSRLAEELVLWSTPQFGYVTLSDGTTTGSSMMPQKKNPDVAELIRGRVGRLTGATMGLATVLKGLPLSYNRDLQEDKFHLFEGLDTTRASVRLTNLMLKEAKFNVERMATATVGDFSGATDIADWLVTKGMVFREAHEVVGRIVRDKLEKNSALETLTLEELKQYSSLFDETALQRIFAYAVMSARTSRGGTSPKSVQFQLEQAKGFLK